MKKRIYSMDFIRAVATIFIFTFHFDMGSLESPMQIYSPSILFHNIDMGSMGVTLFFILSGCGLMYSEKNRDFSLKNYYIKRFWTIFPPFWIAYAFCRLLFETFIPHLFDGIPKRYYFLTLIGMDSFLSYKLPNFSMIGEWFLGCIIIIYIIYPLLRLCMIRHPYCTLLFAFILHQALRFYYPFEMSPLWNPFVRLVEFIFGMFFAKIILDKSLCFSKKQSALICATCLGVLVVLFFADYSKLNIWVMNVIFVCGIFLFILMFELAKFITFPTIQKVIGFISNYSFSIFLVHHPVEMLFAAYFQTQALSKPHLICVYAFYVLTIMLLGVFIQKITEKTVYIAKHISAKKANTV